MKNTSAALPLLILIVLFICMSSASGVSVRAADAWSLVTAKTDGTFSKASASYSTLADAIKAMNDTSDKNTVVVKESNKIVAAMKKGIAVSAGYLDGQTSTVSFLDTMAGRTPYIPNNKAMFYFQTETEARIKVGISGLVNFLPLKQLRLIPHVFLSNNASGDFKSKYPFDYYTRNADDDLVHYISTFSEGDEKKQFDAKENITLSGFVLDAAPDFMKKGKKYYSLDGVNFYTSIYRTKSSKLGTKRQAIRGKVSRSCRNS